MTGNSKGPDLVTDQEDHISFWQVKFDGWGRLQQGGTIVGQHLERNPVTARTEFRTGDKSLKAATGRSGVVLHGDALIHDTVIRGKKTPIRETQ